MDSSQSFNQPPGDYSSSEKSPPVYLGNPAGYPLSFPSQVVPQGPYTQGPYPGQSVVAVQPAVFVSTTPLTNPVPDYKCYSFFTLLCCCLPLGAAALVYSNSTRNANYSGQRELAERNSKTALILNHVAVALGIVCHVLFCIAIYYFFVLE